MFFDIWCEARLPNGNIFDAGHSTDDAREVGMTGL
jgi:hypothetical protein